MDIGRWLQTLTARAGLFLLKRSGAYESYFGRWRGELFDAAERVKLHVTPAHYYSPLPVVADLDESLWSVREKVAGVDLRIEAGLALLDQLAGAYGGEYASFERKPQADKRNFTLANTGYGAGDAEIYYSMLRRFKPKRVIEIGCGNSTLVASMALEENRAEGAAAAEYVCIEPYLPDYLRPTPPGVARIIEKRLQDVSPQEFLRLEAGDFLFIDSSHVAALGSDVVFEYLELLPMLNPGVIVHVHDIFMPFEYPRNWAYKQRYFWNEQYVFQAFLSGNAEWEVLLPAYALWRLHAERFAKAIPSISTTIHGPANFWTRKKGRALN